MDVIRKKDGRVQITLDTLEVAVLHMAFNYAKDAYFEELDLQTSRGAMIIHPDLIKQKYIEFLNQLQP